MRSARSEIVSLLTVLAVPVCMLAVYPYGALTFRINRTIDETSNSPTVESSNRLNRRIVERWSMESPLFCNGRDARCPRVESSDSSNQSTNRRIDESKNSSIAFVTLSAAEEQEALRIAKSSLRGDIGGARRLHIDLAFGELPADEIVPVLPIEDRTRPVGLGRVAHEFSSYLPSQAAGATGILPVAESKPVDERAFSREEMLKLN